MAELLAQRRRVGVENIGTTVTIPDHPTAKLMYYLKCVSTVLQIEDPALYRLIDYTRYQMLNEQEVNALLVLVILFSPQELIGKVFFLDEDLDGCSNEFYELSEVRDTFAASGSVLIGGRTTRVSKIMLFKRVWLDQNYFIPIICYSSQIEKIGRAARANRRVGPADVPYTDNSSDCCCTIL